jgi:hypothetical protein
MRMKLAVTSLAGVYLVVYLGPFYTEGVMHAQV